METPSAPPGIPIIPFAVALESSTLQGLDEPDVMKRKISALVGNNGVVGTIIVLQNSIIVWVGWGKVQQQQPTMTINNSASATTSRSTVVGKGAPNMGPLVVAMPRTSYRGAFGDSLAKGEASCSTLIGSATSEDPLMSGQMASRLSMKSGRAVLVSCQLQQQPHGAPGMSSPALLGDDGDWGAGMDQDMIAYRAAALAEREIWRILQQL